MSAEELDLDALIASVREEFALNDLFAVDPQRAVAQVNQEFHEETGLNAPGQDLIVLSPERSRERDILYQAWMRKRGKQKKQDQRTLIEALLRFVEMLAAAESQENDDNNERQE